jgi:hypothetical protein
MKCVAHARSNRTLRRGRGCNAFSAPCSVYLAERFDYARSVRTSANSQVPELRNAIVSRTARGVSSGSTAMNPARSGSNAGPAPWAPVRCPLLPDRHLQF